MKRSKPVALLVVVLLSSWCIASVPSAAQEQSESFDKPIKETAIDLGASPYYPWPGGRHGQLRCHYFQRFMVKELDWGQKGDDWISITENDAAHAALCSQDHAEGETVFQDWQGGYFGGVKGSFIFLVDADCFDKGCPFGVFEASTRKKLFEDLRRLSPKGKIAEIRFFRSSGGLAMRYPRVVAAKCSLPQKKSECWKEIMHSTGLTPQPAPRCSGYGKDDASDPSVVFIPVEVRIPAFNARILPGPVGCWAAD